MPMFSITQLSLPATTRPSLLPLGDSRDPIGPAPVIRMPSLLVTLICPFGDTGQSQTSTSPGAMAAIWLLMTEAFVEPAVASLVTTPANADKFCTAMLFSD